MIDGDTKLPRNGIPVNTNGKYLVKWTIFMQMDDNYCAAFLLTIEILFFSFFDQHITRKTYFLVRNEGCTCYTHHIVWCYHIVDVELSNVHIADILINVRRLNIVWTIYEKRNQPDLHWGSASKYTPRCTDGANRWPQDAFCPIYKRSAPQLVRHLCSRDTAANTWCQQTLEV